MIGQDILYLEKWPWSDVGDNWMKYRNRPNIDLGDAREINEWIARRPDSALRLAVPSKLAFSTLKREDRSISDIYTHGTTADFALMSTADLLVGRFFTGAENESRRFVIILGYDVADTLFPEGAARAPGEEVKLRGRTFEVIGVLERQGSFLGLQSFDNQVILPRGALERFYGWDRRNHIRVQAKAGVPLERAVDEVTGLYRRIRGLEPGEENDFEINRSEAIEQELGPIKSGIALAGFFVTGLALFVGAIGIMNITFVSVRERTREIGTRRAIGARRRAILLQFLIEAVAICLLGGVIGLGCAFGLKTAIGSAFPSFPFTFSGDLVFLAFVLSVLTGVASGLAPAWQAARLDPANALRHE
ncbi:MAG: FtsX-like permease family protein [Verrucomicrobia bacterium]|jgi:putative ABC transport system permease protein|nr:FtsX-like permease family protein [Verrucomicrobiota bacterium]